MTRTHAHLARLAGALVAGSLVLVGCSDEPSMGSGSMADHGGDSSASESGTHGEADVAFVEGMLPHHEQAVEMAELAPDRAEDPRVVDLAARIQAAQEPEIQTLRGWAEDWGAEVGGSMEGMDHGGMAGGMSMADMESLADASGAEFDAMFLEMMIEHHRGALETAEAQVADGENADAVAMAEDIVDSQTAEIAEMEELLQELAG